MDGWMDGRIDNYYYLFIHYYYYRIKNMTHLLIIIAIEERYVHIQYISQSSKYSLYLAPLKRNSRRRIL